MFDYAEFLRRKCLIAYSKTANKQLNECTADFKSAGVNDYLNDNSDILLLLSDEEVLKQVIDMIESKYNE